MLSFKNIRIWIKLALLICVSLVGLFAVLAFSLSTLHDTMMQDKTAKMLSLSQSARDIAQHFYDRAKAGEFDEATAQKLTKDALRKVRYDKTEYFFIYDTQGTNVLLPPLPEREGKNFIDLKDQDGIPFIRGLIDSAKTGNAVFYTFPKGEKKIPTGKVGISVSFAPWDWIVGTGLYTDDIERDFQNILMNVAAIFFPITLLVCLIGWALAHSITGPLREITHGMRRLADGDLEITISNQERKDEIGELSKTMDTFLENAKKVQSLKKEQEEQKRKAEGDRHAMLMQMADDFEHNVRGIVSAVSQASQEMHGSAEKMAEIAELTSTQSATVSAAAEEASANVQTVASAAEELSSSIEEISRQITDSVRVAGECVKEAEHTSSVMGALSQQADSIGSVVKLIEGIASQVNLLALNATIEAARAGEAGRGFAVVANEVKTLANQVANAAQDITHQVQGVQTQTGQAVVTISKITGTIQHINEISSAIAAAVQEQGAATREISHSIHETSQGTAEVTRNITGVTHSASETGAASSMLLSTAVQLEHQSQSLSAVVDSFITTIRQK